MIPLTFLRSRPDPGFAKPVSEPPPKTVSRPEIVLGPMTIRLEEGASAARIAAIARTRNGSVPLAEDGVKRIGEQYRIETELRGFDPEVRMTGRKERSAPLVADMQSWLVHQRATRRNQVAARRGIGLHRQILG
jgi:hypothetical protein